MIVISWITWGMRECARLLPLLSKRKAVLVARWRQRERKNTTNVAGCLNMVDDDIAAASWTSHHTLYTTPAIQNNNLNKFDTIMLNSETSINNISLQLPIVQLIRKGNVCITGRLKSTMTRMSNNDSLSCTYYEYYCGKITQHLQQEQSKDDVIVTSRHSSNTPRPSLASAVCYQTLLWVWNARELVCSKTSSGWHII